MQLAGKRITKYGCALLAITLIGLFLRLYQLSAQSVWYDEAFSIWIAQLSVPQLLQTQPQVDASPPLYYLFLHYWVTTFGDSEFAVRSLSVVFGVLAIPMTYLVGRRLFDREAGLVAALLLALSPFNIYYSQEARMYSMMVLLALLSMYFFLRLLQRRLLQRRDLALSAGYVFFTGLLVYTHYYGWFVVIAQNVYVLTLWLLLRERAFKLRVWVPLQAIVVALYVPWIPVLSNPALRLVVTLFGRNITAAWITNTFVTYAGGSVVGLALFLGLSVLSLFSYQKVPGATNWRARLKSLESYVWQVRLHDPAPVYFLTVWVLAINLIPFVISEIWSPIYFERYTIAASVALYLLVAKGIRNINGKYAKLAVIGVIVVLLAPNLQAYYTSVTKPPGREPVSVIDTNFKSGDVVLVTPSLEILVFDYYNNRTDVVVKPIHTVIANYALNASVKETPSPPSNAEFWAPSSGNVTDVIKEIRSAVSGHNRVWWFTDNWYDYAPQTLTYSVLKGSYPKTYVKSYYADYGEFYNAGYDTWLFEKGP
jgi:uncharacterized membrane protein